MFDQALKWSSLINATILAWLATINVPVVATKMPINNYQKKNKQI